LPGLDVIAVAYAQLPDDAGGQMLYLFDVTIDCDRSGRDHCTCDIRGRSPAAEYCDQRYQDSGASHDVAPGGAQYP
jgi:hypothetical protein